MDGWQPSTAGHEMCSATWAPGTEEKGLTALRKELGGQEHCWLLLIGDSCQPQAVSTRPCLGHRGSVPVLSGRLQGSKACLDSCAVQTPIRMEEMTGNLNAGRWKLLADPGGWSS